ncbi:hypothetical protein G7Z17_g8031 [Cylindrodendrum hubeiense]|uniref:Uncharacterized protein n=1 Tax=Cylindrodendrum hubeiense TaxID=595255 RepID=A0A9P5H1Y1_9HYPO|nr:hypothetical protein G7Z17_g8031 [Cylindrodendrum hubeiense]
MNRHANLYQALTEFYTTLVQLGIAPTSLLHLPDATEGADDFDAEAAREAGFSPEAIKLMGTLPYLDVHDGNTREGGLEVGWGVEMMPGTYPVCFAPQDADVGFYESLRDMEDDDEGQIPGTSIRLSTQEDSGTTLIYDTKTCLMREWTSCDNDEDVEGYDHVIPKLPSDILGPWSKRYRQLEYLGYVGEVFFDIDEDPRRNDGLSGRDREAWQANSDLRVARLKLREIYRECGWDTESKTQDGFDRELFISVRQRYYTGVIKPLQEYASGFVNGGRPTQEPVLQPWRDEL